MKIAIEVLQSEGRGLRAVLRRPLRGHSRCTCWTSVCPRGASIQVSFKNSQLTPFLQQCSSHSASEGHADAFKECVQLSPSHSWSVTELSSSGILPSATSVARRRVAKNPMWMAKLIERKSEAVGR